MRHPATYMGTALMGWCLVCGAGVAEDFDFPHPARIILFYCLIGLGPMLILGVSAVIGWRYSDVPSGFAPARLLWALGLAFVYAALVAGVVWLGSAAFLSSRATLPGFLFVASALALAGVVAGFWAGTPSMRRV